MLKLHLSNLHCNLFNYLCSQNLSSKYQTEIKNIINYSIRLFFLLNAWICSLTCKVYQNVSVSELMVSLTG